MGSAWFGLNTAVSGLRAAQQQLEATAHNVSNASTPGYSRQRVRLEASTPYALPVFARTGLPGMVGTGVTIAGIERARDVFLDSQINEQASLGGYWTAREEFLGRVETIFPEPSELGLGTALDRFWGAWEGLAADPASNAARTSVLAEAQTIATRFSQAAGQLGQLASGVDDQVRTTVDQVNDIAHQLASLNDQIQSIVVTGDNANDLEDRRDALLEELSALVPVTAHRRSDGSVTVLIAGTDLVDHGDVRPIGITADANGNAVPTWPSGDPVEIGGGRLGALVELRDVTIAGYQDQLNTLAEQLAGAINTAHAGGVDANGNAGLALFTYTPGDAARTLAVNPLIGSDPARVAAAAAAGQPGDGSVAALIADLRTSATFGTGTQTPGAFYTGLVGQVGSDARQAAELDVNQASVLAHLRTRRESVRGVSLDEEAADVIRFQHAYQAAARLISAMDEMLDQLINRTGVVGR